MDGRVTRPGGADDASAVLVPVVDSMRVGCDVTFKDRLTTSRLRDATVWQRDLRRNYKTASFEVDSHPQLIYPNITSCSHCQTSNTSYRGC